MAERGYRGQTFPIRPEELDDEAVDAPPAPPPKAPRKPRALDPNSAVIRVTTRRGRAGLKDMKIRLGNELLSVKRLAPGEGIRFAVPFLFVLNGVEFWMLLSARACPKEGT